MGVPAVPTKLENLGDRAFSFYPPIVGVDHNEWRFLQSTWSEVLVRNARAAMEIWIPRSYLGEISTVDDPVMIVGLKLELEYKSGTVWPHTRRVLQMPATPLTPARPAGPEPPRESGIASLRMASDAESRIGRLILIALASGLVLTFFIVTILRKQHTGEAIEYRGILQTELGLDAKSDYYDVVRKLGPPEQDRWRSQAGERQYRLLGYPRKDLVIIMMGADRKSALYIGAKNNNWHTVHAVALPGGRNTEPVLRALPRF